MNPSHFDLNLLRTFKVIFNTGSLTEAASLLNVTQPAVSGALGRLRDQTCDPLFVRTRNGMVPTPAAEQLYQQIMLALNDIDRSLIAMQEFDPAQATDIIRCALTSYFDPLMPALARRLQAQAPGLRLQRVHFNYEENLRQLRSGHISMMLVPEERPPAGCLGIQLAPDRLVLIARKSHPRLRELRAGASLSEFAVAGLLNDDNVTMLQHLAKDSQSGADQVPTMEVTNFFSLAHLVAETDYVALMPERIARVLQRTYDLTVAAVEASKIPVPVTLAWAEITAELAPHRWLREQVTQLLDEVPADFVSLQSGD